MPKYQGGSRVARLAAAALASAQKSATALGNTAEFVSEAKPRVKAREPRYFRTYRANKVSYHSNRMRYGAQVTTPGAVTGHQWPRSVERGVLRTRHRRAIGRWDGVSDPGSKFKKKEA